MVQYKPNFSEEMSPKQSRVNDDSAVVEEPSTKPKRVLTEAQRLAFLKGREKRMANIERKRQEKLEAEQATIEDETPAPTPKSIPVKPDVIIEEINVDKGEKKEDDEEKEDLTPPIPLPPSPPVVRRQANSDETAKRIADLVLERMELGLKVPTSTRTRGRPKKKIKTPLASSLAASSGSDSDSYSSSPPFPEKTSQVPYAPPQRVFNWM